MSVYDRELALSSRLNAFLHDRFDLPAADYYARLDMGGLAELKSLLSDINNIFTLKVCLSFGSWLADRLHLSAAAHDAIRQSILSNPPNANGYDIEISEPINVIAEVKCNIPINGGVIYPFSSTPERSQTNRTNSMLFTSVRHNKALQTDTASSHAPCIRKGRATLPCR